MNSRTVELVQGSFQKVAPIAPQAAEIFYTKLFEKDPSLRALFSHSDMTEQGKKLMMMLGTAVNGLTNLDAIISAVQDLGKRHVGYGVKDEHYDTVGAALLETLEVGLGEEWNDELKTAWTEVYITLATVMKDAAKEVEVEEDGLTEKKIAMVQSSFQKVVPIADKAAEIFYAKLFEKDPSLKALFSHSDMKEQGKKLMAMLATAVGGLTNLNAIISAVQDLGKRHVGYGVKDEHYDTVGAALLETLEVGLGDEWNNELKTAWTEVYVTLATVMKDAAKDVKPEPVPAAVVNAPVKKWWQIWK